MRNLSLNSLDAISLADCNIHGIAIDLDEDILYAASESISSIGEVNVEIYRVDKKDFGTFSFRSSK